MCVGNFTLTHKTGVTTEQEVTCTIVYSEQPIMQRMCGIFEGQLLDRQYFNRHSVITWLHTGATKYNLRTLGTYFDRERIKCTYLDFA